MSFRFLGDESNTQREEPEEPAGRIGIYRNFWKRRGLSQDAVDGRLNDVWDQFKYPSWADLMRAKERARERQAKRPDKCLPCRKFR